jgi:RNA polymerase sigma-70 factor (ECF subfamily)
LETTIRDLLGQQDLRGAATRTIEGYGPELYAFLVTLVRDAGDASEVFSQTCEDLWSGLGAFEGRCTMRTWFYTLARHAAARFRREPQRRRGRRVPISQVSEFAERVRTGTASYLRTEAKDELASIRDGLEDDDRALLVLRVDRGMSWNEIAQAFPPDDPDDAQARVAARLRKRFQLVKTEIRRRAQQVGLLSG